LGTNIDASHCTICATDKRINNILCDLEYLHSLCSSPVQVKTIASTIAITLGNFVGKVTRLMTRNLFSVINSRSSWHSIVSLTPDSLTELGFWKENVACLNEVPIWPVQSKDSKIVYSDASNSGCGSVIDFDGKVFHQNGVSLKKSQSSTYRELKAVLLSLQAFQL
jgi:hypothetical protein